MAVNNVSVMLELDDNILFQFPLNSYFLQNKSFYLCKYCTTYEKNVAIILLVLYFWLVLLHIGVVKTNFPRTIYANDQLDNKQCSEEFQPNKVFVKRMDYGANSIVDKICIKHKWQSWTRLTLFAVLFVVTPLSYFIAEKSFNYAENYGMLKKSNLLLEVLLYAA